VEENNTRMGCLGLLAIIFLIAALIAWPALWIVVIILVALLIWAAVRSARQNARAEQEMNSWITEHGGTPAMALSMVYRGGHPLIDRTYTVLLWRENKNIHLTYRDQIKQIRDAVISRDDVAGIRYIDNQLAVQIDKGSSGLFTAGAGLALFGPLGGIFGYLIGHRDPRQDIRDKSYIEVALASSKSIVRLSSPEEGGTERLYPALVPWFTPSTKAVQ
jgi:hypothetical protein